MVRLRLLVAAALLLAPTFAGTAPVERLTPERSQTLLFDAAKLGRADLVPALVASGADVNGRDARGFTPLILAAYNDHLETVEALLRAKADACLPDRDQGNSAQMGVAFKGYDAIAARLLKTGCDVNYRNKAGQTALMMAALFGRTAQIDMLTKAGADARLTDQSGRSASAVAAAQGNEALAESLAQPKPQ